MESPLVDYFKFGDNDSPTTVYYRVNWTTSELTALSMNTDTGEAEAFMFSLYNTGGVRRDYFIAMVPSTVPGEQIGKRVELTDEVIKQITMEEFLTSWTSQVWPRKE